VPFPTSPTSEDSGTSLMPSNPPLGRNTGILSSLSVPVKALDLRDGERVVLLTWQRRAGGTHGESNEP
jgi:hypothetical protein